MGYSLESLDSIDSLRVQKWLRGIVGSLALLAIIFSATGVVVREGEAVLITRFGRLLRAATAAGAALEASVPHRPRHAARHAPPRV